jgi:hypothetical protein
MTLEKKAALEGRKELGLNKRKYIGSWEEDRRCRYKIR